MSTREYVVCLNKDVDYDQFWDEIENESDTDGFIPSRRVDIVNERIGSLRSCHYALTEQEAEKLRDDPRVYCVEIPPEQRDDIYLIKSLITQEGNFTKPSSNASSGDKVNWGLIRHNSNTNVYGTSTDTSLSYVRGHSGIGVDVVITDSGIQPDHPEFQNQNGQSRVQLIDWYQASGIPGTQNANHYRDYDGHGTHVAGIVAGKTYGWAKNSRIYSIKLGGLEGEGDSGTGIPILDSFDILASWHANKPIDPNTGFKRPTVVNMSWGYSATYIILDAVNGMEGEYRGTPWASTTFDLNKGMKNQYSSWPARVSSVDVALEELIDAGVVVCIAAGNNDHKIDVPGGLDYDNYYSNWFDYNGTPTLSSLKNYYHRGSSPYSDKAIIVGSLRDTPYDSTLDRKSTFSNAGPGVDIYAAGSQIMSSTSNNNSYNGPSYQSADYFLNSNYKQVNLSGTSMASPQVTGVAALYFEKYPNKTPAEFKTWLITNSSETIYQTGLNDDYTVNQSTYGGNNHVLFVSNELLLDSTRQPDDSGGGSSFSSSFSPRFIQRLKHMRAYKRLNRLGITVG